MIVKSLINRFLFKYIREHWNIAIADMGADLTPVNIKWMKHPYTDRWFADPFFIDEDKDHYVILVEEFLRDTGLGRLARLIVEKEHCKLVSNKTILDTPTHLSFPIPIKVDGETYIYPENAASGATPYYQCAEKLKVKGLLSPLPLADPVIYKSDDCYYLFATLPERCNGNVLNVYKSNNVFGSYELSQEIAFNDNVARRAGQVFVWKGKLISPAQICNNHYGEGVCLQELTIKDGLVSLDEIKRIFPTWHDEYNHAFHTYNVMDGKIVMDGNKINWSSVSKLYKKVRKIE